MTGLYHTKAREAVGGIVSGVLAFLRGVSSARAQIASHPFDVPDIRVSLNDTLSGVDNKVYLAAVGAIAEHEWLAMQVSKTENDWTGRLGLLDRAEFTLISDYLTAITAVCAEQRTAILTYRDPRALARSITNFDITCELVLNRPLVKRPAISRMLVFGQDAASHGDLKEGISAIWHLTGELDVPKKRSDPPHATGRLLAYLVAGLPTIDQVRVQEAIDLMDAVRDIRNT